jgi:hypothetical protein
MRAFDRDLIRGGHYGQRSWEPRNQAEHMAAPTSAANVKNPCQLGAVHTWQILLKKSGQRSGSTVEAQQDGLSFPKSAR